ncbi:unnamed protein product [Diamesa serratosioi]
MNSVSVYQLLTSLCENLSEDYRKSRSQAYEILLFESQTPCLKINEKQELKNIETELEFGAFELLLQTRTQQKRNEIHIEFAKTLEFLQKNKTDELKSVLTLLLALKNTNNDIKNELNFFQFPTLKCEKKRSSKTNSFLLITGAQEYKYEIKPPSTEFNFLSQNLLLSINNQIIPRKKATVPKISTVVVEKPSEIISIPKVKDGTYNWQQLGKRGVNEEPSFITESKDHSTIHHFATYAAKEQRKVCTLKIISQEKLIEDVKLLCVGTISEIFSCNDSYIFYMEPHYTIEGISTTVLQGLMQELLESGSCYKRLRTMITKNPFNFKLIFDGYVFKVFCDCIKKFLDSYRKIVLSITTNSLSMLILKISKMKKILISLAEFLKIHPSSVCNQVLPIGSDFLGFLYNEFITISQPDVKSFFTYLLKSCCNVYFSCYRKWLFEGLLDDPNKELFIYFVDNYRPKTKYFFDKAYAVRRQSVPRFLQGFENDILLCGKYTMLLKSYKPQHPFFTLKRLPITVCLTQESIDELNKECCDFQNAAREACGNNVSVDDILMERKGKEHQYYTMSKDKNLINIQRWKEEQEVKAIELCRVKQKKLVELQLQIQEIEERKLRQRMENIELDRRYLEEAENKEAELLEQENKERLRRIEYYQQLNEMMDERENTRQLLNADLQKSLIEHFDDPDSMMMSLTSEHFDPDEVFQVLELELPKEKPLIHEEDVMNESYKKQLEVSISTMTHSKSDIINANVILSEFQINKTRALGSTTLLSQDVFNNVVDIPSTTMTEFQRNKLKVLKNEFNFELSDGHDTMQECPTIIVENVEHFSELQKNRKKIMSHENNFENLNNLSRDELSLNLSKPLTTRAHNKKKVLNSEYNIITGHQDVSDYSPMSIGSNSEVFLTPELIPSEISFDHVSTEIDDVEEVDCSIEDQKETEISTDSSETFDEENFNEFAKAFQKLHRNENSFLQLNLCKSSEEKSEFQNFCSKNSQLKSIDSMSLTQQLQLSLIIPLKTYMEVLNNEVLKIYLVDLDILTHFKSLLKYFFLMDGEFGSNICNGLLRKLESGAKPNELLNYQTLHRILENALGSSVYSNDPNAECLSFIVQSIPDKFELNSPNVLNMLSLSYKVSWPLNLILNPETLEQYSNIFKYLFKLKRVKWIMDEVWVMLKENHKILGVKLQKSQQYRHVQQIRHKMSHFVYCLENHVTRSALQSSWKTFENDLKSTKCIGDLYRIHTRYIKRIIFLCLLNKNSLEFYKNVEEIFKVILKFHKHLQCKTWNLNDSIYNHPKYEKMAEDERDFEKLIKYTIYLGNKIVAHGYQMEIGELINMININGYYQN